MGCTHIQSDRRREKEKCRHQDGDHLQEDRRGLPVYVAVLIFFAVVFAVFFLLVFMFCAAAAYLKAAVGQCSAGRLGQDLFNYSAHLFCPFTLLSICVLGCCEL
uniref:Uncharacterized protein n=1 Tax=Gossypium raimondii TaxID=29730 RepID=A0A0D2VDW8_GOSRA|nr:hypothetical protein B456_013G117200 [Gossypium raimondii]